ncbi:MAG: CoA-binding protein [Acidobacteria bacterium]|nr:CoA-binding protein [Acidobacteriota bacterium]
MMSRKIVDEFLSQKTLALVGVSRNGEGFGNMVRKELAGKGYSVLLVHPEADLIAGAPCVRSLKDLATRVGGVILVTPPASTSTLVREAAEAGIRRIWIQQGAESPEAIQFCEQQGLAAVHGECILMFAEPTKWFHRIHRGINKVVGKLPH